VLVQSGLGECRELPAGGEGVVPLQLLVAAFPDLAGAPEVNQDQPLRFVRRYTRSAK